jgi:hypothetical protein
MQHSPFGLRDSGKAIPVGGHNKKWISNCGLPVNCWTPLEIIVARRVNPFKRDHT